MRAEKDRILVIDDEPTITRLLKLNLEQTGRYVVATLNSSNGAVETALHFHPDLILLDLNIPGQSGDHLASIFQEHPLLKSVPIVILTALATEKEVEEHHGVLGGMPMLAKPVDIGKVLACLAAHLQPVAGQRPLFTRPAG